MVERQAGAPKPTKDMVLRLDPELAKRLRLVADVEGRSISDVAREAIAALVERRRGDKRFRRLLEESLVRHEQAIRLLGEDTEPGADAQRGGTA
jgi:predicted transcriptional regulator